MKKLSGTTAAVFVLSMLAAQGGEAQLTLASAGTTARKGTDPVEIEARAKALFANPKRYDEAAKLFLRAAEQRVTGDPERINDLIMASRLIFYRGDETRARSLMETAADEALAFGDIVTAANAYLDAAFLARDAGEAEKVTSLTRKAEQLTASPLMPEADKRSLKSRLPDGM